MLIRKSAYTAPWTQALAREVTQPVFPRIPRRVRPYLLALTLFAAASALMYLSEAVLMRYGLPWPLVSLLLIVAAANLWGVGPAVLVLVLSGLYGAAVVPHIQALPLTDPASARYMLIMRTSLFAACGTATIWLTYRARLMQDRAETRREVVMSLQSMTLPTALAEATGYDLCGLYRPAHQEEEVGGDFYDFYPTGTGLYCLLIGDVMGKGKEAAASTALLRYSTRAFCSSGAQPAQIMDQLNTLIETQGLPFGTASLFVGFLNPRSGSLCYANAGHEPPLLKCAEGEEHVLASTGPILGIGLGMTYEENVVTLGPRDALLLMTDGVTEARNKHGEFLGSAGAWWMLRTALRGSSSQTALASLDQRLSAYIGANSRDDIAMLLLRRTSERTDPPRNSGADGSAAKQTGSGHSAPALTENLTRDFVPR